MSTLGTAMIIGVGPGLGLALTRTFVGAGHPVAMLARDTTRLDRYVAELDPPGQPVRAYTADAADPSQLRGLCRRRSLTSAPPMC